MLTPPTVSGVFSMFLQGLVAGLALALPLGAISVLLLHEAFAHGWRPAAAGALGVALVDLTYAIVAVTAGTVVSRALAGHERWVHLIGAAVLVGVAVRGLLALRGAGAPSMAAADAEPARPPEPGGTLVRPGAVLGRFVALTAINPLTAVYFVVLATGLAISGPGAATTFILGVFIGSLSWQLALVGIGAAAGERLPDGVRTAVGVIGYLIVLGYAVRLALS